MYRFATSIVLSLTLLSICHAQTDIDTIYFSSHGFELTNQNIENAAYYQLTTGERKDGKVNQYFMNHAPYGYVHYLKGKRHGNYVTYYKNGNIKESGLFGNGKAVGLRKRRYSNGTMRSVELMKDDDDSNHAPRIVNAWDSLGNFIVSEGNGDYRNTLFNNSKIIEEGTIKDGYKVNKWVGSNSERVLYEDTYNDKGELISGLSYDDQGNSYTYTEFEEDATYKGGMDGWNNHLRRNLRYPKEAKRAGDQGNVYLSFIIMKSGKVQKAEIIRGVSHACDEEALRVLRLSKNWNPGKQRGQPVIQRMNLRVIFRLR